MNVTVHREAHFNAAHRLYNPNWSDLKNEEVFGKCANPNYHGHNYKLIVSVTGSVHKETGYVIDMKLLKKIINEHVIQTFDHKNLNKEVPPFHTVIPTAENISIEIWRILRRQIQEDLLLEITLYETPRNFVTYNGN